MSFLRVLRPTNRRIRLGVGLLLLALFFMQCTRSDADRGPSRVTAISGQTVGQAGDAELRRFESLAAGDHITLLREGLSHYGANYQDYTCTFIKQERIDGQLRPEQIVEVKFRQQPFSVVMNWLQNSPGGKSALYVQGRYDGQMLVVPTGVFAWVGTVSRDPEGKDVMATTLRPITMFGFENMMKNLLGVYETAAQRGELKVACDGWKEIDGKRVLALRRVLPPREDYPAKTTIWYFDPQHQLPMGMEAYDWDDQVICSYVFKDVRLNVGLGEEAFSPEANGMKAPK